MQSIMSDAQLPAPAQVCHAAEDATREQLQMAMPLARAIWKKKKGDLESLLQI